MWDCVQEKYTFFSVVNGPKLEEGTLQINYAKHQT